MAATLVGDLNDPEYRNWYKANRALLCTIDVLRHVCFAEMQNFHNSLVHKHGRRTCNGPCTHTDVVAHGQWGSWSLQCPSNVCSQWLTDITRKSAKTSTRLIWQNSDFSQWQTEPWQIAKIYMNRGQEKTCVKPDDTDAAGVLQLLMNFKGFQNVLDTAKVDAVRKKRNALMHSHNMKVSDTDLAIYIQTMVDLLEDPVKLLQDPAAQQAVTDITMIESTVIEVKDSAFLVQERMVWKQHLASLADANKQEILKLVSNNAKLANRLRGQEKRLDEMTEEKEHVNGLRRKEIIRNIGFLTATCFLLAAALWLRHTENIHGNQWIQQTTINIILIFWVALVVPVVLIGRIKGTDNAWLTAVIVIWITLGLPFLLPQMETYRIQDELQQWRLHLRDAQRRSLELYILKKNEDEGMSFQNLSDIYVELRMVSTSDHYKRLETRTRYGNLNLMMQTAAYPKINVTDLFVAKRPEMTTPVRSLLTGSAGIGKTSLCLHIIEQWLKGELLPLDIHHVFLIHLRYLTGNNTCSIEDLFFKYQPCTRPGDEAIGEFFKQLFADPDKTLLILDGWDEIKTETTEKQYVYDHNEQVDMPRLVASIINRSNIPSVRVLVTSRPRGVTNFYTYDKKAEIYGFTQETISDYIVKFSGEDHNLQMSINDYIDANVNINSFCYIPVQLNMVCRIVKDKMHHKNNPELPETFTELSVAAVENMLIYHHPDFKYQHLDETVNVIANLKEYVLNHARIARYGLEQSPIKIMFTKKDVHLFQLDNVTMKYGLMTESSESGTVTYKRNVASVFYFQHLTLQELLAAVALLADINQVENMMSRASDRQLDVMLVFMAGLLGNNRTYPFLDALQLKRIANLDKFIKLVVDLEQRNVASIQNEEDRSTAHKSSTFFLVMLLYESRQVQLWRHMSKYILKNSSVLDLSGYIISPTELHALVYVLPETRISSLILADCGLTGTEAVNLLRVLRHLPVLTELNLQNNHDLHGSEMTAALSDSLVHLTQLEGIQLDGCGLTDEDIARLTASLAHLRKLSILWLNGNSITNVGALKLTTVAVKLPYLESLGLCCNWLTKDGTDGVRVRSTPRVRLDILDLQRPPGEELPISSTVENVQRSMDIVQSALSRLRGRPLKDRDSYWDEDVADMQGMLVSIKDKLRVERMTQVTDDFLRLSSDLRGIQQQLYVSLAAKPDEEFPADLVVKWQRHMDQTKSALYRLQDSYWAWDEATKQILLEKQRMLERDEYRLRLTLSVVRMTQPQVTQDLARLAQYRLDISQNLRDTNVELQRVMDQLQPIISRLLEQPIEDKDSSWDEDVADMQRMLDHRRKILVLFITQVTQDLTRFTQDLVRTQYQPYVLLAVRPGEEFLTVQAWQHFVDSIQSFLSLLQDSSWGLDVATIQRILEAQRELDRAQEVLRLALSGQDSQQ